MSSSGTQRESPGTPRWVPTHEQLTIEDMLIEALRENQHLPLFPPRALPPRLQQAQEVHLHHHRPLLPISNPHLKLRVLPPEEQEEQPPYFRNSTAEGPSLPA